MNPAGAGQISLLWDAGRPFLLLLLVVLYPGGEVAAARDDGSVPLVVHHRTIHVFKSSLGALSAAERAELARRHITSALTLAGDGWTSIEPIAGGYLVTLDGTPMFTVTEGDASPALGETPERLANDASRKLQKVWAESRDRNHARPLLPSLLRVAAAALALAAVVFAMQVSSRLLREAVLRHLTRRLHDLARPAVGSRVVTYVLGSVVRLLLVLTWLVNLLAVIGFLSYALRQFPATRVHGERLAESVQGILVDGTMAAAAALPGLFIAIVIFMLARVATQIARAFFEQIVSGQFALGSLDSHTAPVTQQIVNVSIWLFALAMAYPYLPGSHTEAFKGLSVIVGLMVSIGASGLVGQVASGMILVFTRSLLPGEYVRIQGAMGRVVHLGPFVTRVRTDSGEEIMLPNSLVISNITRNYSRGVAAGDVLETPVTIGYDAPWRQVHALLTEAASRIEGLCREPAPYVVQRALSDFYVEYCLIVYVERVAARSRATVVTHLAAEIQDAFNRAGVQIMSPHYLSDPAAPKIVPETAWRGARDDAT